MCNETHNKLYGLGLTDVIEVRKHIVYMPDNIIVFLPEVIQYTAARGSLMQLSYTTEVSENVYHLFLIHSFPV